MSIFGDYLQRIQDIVQNADDPAFKLEHLKREVVRDDDLSDEELATLELEIDETISELDKKNEYEDSNYLVYDYSKINVNLTPWQSLNPKNLPYPIFLRDYVLPTFHPLPEGSLQYPLLATYCMINSNSLPPASSGILKELPLSILYVSGTSGSGKSELQKRIGTHYPANAKYMWMGDSTGTSLIRECHRVCHVTDEILRPAYIWMDNFYPSGNNSTIKRLGTSYTAILGVLRSQAMTNSCTPQDTNTYYTHCLKSISSIMPIERASAQAGELIRRCMFIFTEKSGKVPSAGKFNWLSVKDEYLSYWTKEQTEDNFFPILSEVMSINDDETKIPAQYFPQSSIVIATGVHCGIFSSITDACEYLAEYWKWVEDKLSKPTDPTLGLIEFYLQFNGSNISQGTIVKNLRVKHNLTTLTNFVSEKLGGRTSTKTQERIIEIMSDKGYVQEVDRGGQIVFYKS